MVMVGQNGRYTAGEGDQGKGAHAGHRVGGVLTLQADQQTQQNGDSQLLKQWLH